MAGNEGELPDEDGSTRLRDRAQSRLEQARDIAELRGSTRLRDRAMSGFERRRQQAQRAREAVEQRGERFAEALDLSPGQIDPVQLDDRGEDIGFVPDESAQEVLAERFAEQRRFVEPADALVDADPREGVQTRTDPGAIDEIAARAQQSVAAEDQFAEPGDFAADVGPGGVEEVRLTPRGELRRAGRQFESETALETVDPSSEIERSDDGFSLTGGADERLAARRFEDSTDTFGQGELDPSNDVRETDDGFGLSRDPARELAADRLDRQVESVDVGPSDIELTETESGDFEAVFEGGR
jgi:hypothetical protein